MELVSGEPGGPERAWLESVRRQGELSQDQLAAAPPFRVAGLAMPLVEPSYLAGWSWESMTTHGRAEGATVHGEGVHEISLFYGRMDAPAGPAVTVTTSIVGDYGHQVHSLEYELADERDRLFDHAGIDEPDPSGTPAHVTGLLRIGGAPVQADVCRHGELWAARAELALAEAGPNNNRLVVTVVALGIAFEKVELAWVEDLRPLVLARRRLLDERLAEGPPPSPTPTFPPDLDVHRELIEGSLRQARQIEEALAEGRPPSPRPRSSGRDHHALWQAAVESQSQRRSQSAEQANAAVTAMVNQMTQLAEAAPWFGDAPLRAAAIGETVAYTARGEVVPSQRAQEAWEAYWATRPSPPFFRQAFESGDIDRDRRAALAREHRDRYLGDRGRWLQEWALWAMERGW